MGCVIIFFLLHLQANFIISICKVAQSFCFLSLNKFIVIFCNFGEPGFMIESDIGFELVISSVDIGFELVISSVQCYN